MKRTIGAAFLLFGALVAAVTVAQVSPQTLPASTVWGRLGISAGPGQAIPFSILQGNLQLTMSGDCATASPNVITCTKTNGVAFAASATTNTANASNISSGSLALARIASIAAYDTLCNPTSASAAPIACQNGVLHSKDVGAVGDDSTDDTTALQAWITACQTNNLICHLDAGTYKITTALAVTNALTIRGAGIAASVLHPSTTIDALDVTTTLAVQFENFGISYTSAAAGGTKAISVTASGSSINSSSMFRNMQILNANYCIQFLQAQTFVVDNLKCSLFAVVGVLVQNAGNVDSGDSTIVSSYLLAASSAATACLQWVSSGGFRFENNKCLTAASGMQIALASAAGTAQLIVTGNSFDGMTGAALTMVRQGATGTFARVIFSANICNLVLNCVQVGNDANGAWLTAVTITNNSYIGINSASAIAFDLNQMNGLVLSGNLSQSQHNSTINVRSASANITSCIIGPNLKVGTFAAGTVTPCSSGQNLVVPSGI